MTTLKGLLDGDTAAALRGLYGVGESEAPQTDSVESKDWDDGDADSQSEPVYCDRCGEELAEAELPDRLTAKDVLCDVCDRRANSSAVGRFLSARDLELD